jgi:hypothetical protein
MHGTTKKMIATLTGNPRSTMQLSLVMLPKVCVPAVVVRVWLVPRFLRRKRSRKYSRVTNYALFMRLCDKLQLNCFFINLFQIAILSEGSEKVSDSLLNRITPSRGVAKSSLYQSASSCKLFAKKTQLQVFASYLTIVWIVTCLWQTLVQNLVLSHDLNLAALCYRPIVCCVSDHIARRRR